MKKSNLITGILHVLFGVACLIVALLIETKLEGILWGFAGAGIFPGIMMICKYFYWSSPKNRKHEGDRNERGFYGVELINDTGVSTYPTGQRYYTV